MQIGPNNPQSPVKFMPAPPPQSRTGPLPSGPHRSESGPPSPQLGPETPVTQPSTPLKTGSKLKNFQKPKVSQTISKQQQLTSPVKQQSIVNTILHKGVVQTGQLPKLSFLQKPVTPLHSRPQTEEPEREQEVEEHQGTHPSIKKPKEKETSHTTAPTHDYHFDPLPKQDPLPPGKEQQKPSDEQDKGGKGQQQQQQQERRREPEEYESSESDYEKLSLQTQSTETLEGYSHTPRIKSPAMTSDYEKLSLHNQPAETVEGYSHTPGIKRPSTESDYEKLSHDGLPLSDQSSSDPTSSQKPSFKPSHKPVKKDMGALLQNQNATKSILPQYAKTSMSEQIIDGVEKTLEHKFKDEDHEEGGEKTLFFTSQTAQNLNKVSFVKGSAKTTVLKQYEDLAHQIGEIESKLMQPEQSPDKTEVELRQELMTLKEKQASFVEQVGAYNQATQNYEQLVATKASPKEIEQAKSKLDQAEQQLRSQLDDLTSDVHLLGSGTQVKVGGKQENRLIFVMSPSGEFYSMNQEMRDLRLPDGHTVISSVKIHHTSLLDGQNVQGGGELRVGSQFDDLHQEIDLTQPKEKIKQDYHDAKQKLADTREIIQHKAEKGVERRFVESFKSQHITGINQQIRQLESQGPLGPDDAKQLSTLKSQRTELLNEGFLRARSRRRPRCSKNTPRQKPKNLSLLSKKSCPKSCTMYSKRSSPRARSKSFRTRAVITSRI